MKIKDMICCQGRTGFYFDDQLAIRNNAENDGMAYVGEPETFGFSSIRQGGESILIMILLENGSIAYGDCAAVQYSGAAGRDPLFLADHYIPLIQKEIAPIFIGEKADNFRRLSDILENQHKEKKYHTAIRYGLSQALLDAVSKNHQEMMAETIAREYQQIINKHPIPIFTQSGDDRYDNADKMIIKKVEVMPHGLFNHINKLGQNGEKLLDYILWLKERIQKLNPNYNPIFHIDVYGMIGYAFQNNIQKIVAYLNNLAKAAAPYKLYIEGAADLGNKEQQMQFMRDLRKNLDENQIPVQLVVDEWCNTLEDIQYFADNKAGHIIQIKTPDLGSIANSAEAVLYCKEKGIGTYLGGTCNETEKSAAVCVHLGLGIGCDQILAKPGMGVDEGYMIVYNEMSRILNMLQYKDSKH